MLQRRNPFWLGVGMEVRAHMPFRVFGMQPLGNRSSNRGLPKIHHEQRQSHGSQGGTDAAFRRRADRMLDYDGPIGVPRLKRTLVEGKAENHRIGAERLLQVTSHPLSARPDGF